MCGIVGMTSLDGNKQWQHRKEWITKAIYADTMRGKDSTGLALIDSKHLDNVHIFKKAMPGYDFLELKYVSSLLYNIDFYRHVIGHNRAATKGGVTAQNAHPFEHGNITLVHNGTLDSFAGLDKKFVVDSEAICNEMSLRPAKEVLEDLDGAYALVWYDSLDNSLHFARNKDRPFSFAFTEDGKTLFYASEGWMIRHLLPAGLKIGDVYTLNPGKHIIFKKELEDLRDYEVEDFTPFVKKYVPMYPDSYYGDYGDYPLTAAEVAAQNKREADKAKSLAAFGYRTGEDIIFSGVRFTPHIGDDIYGNVTGYTSPVGSVGVVDEVRVYHVRRDLLGDAKDLTNKMFIGKAVSARDFGSKVTVVVNNIKHYVPLPEDDTEDTAEEKKQRSIYPGPTKGVSLTEEQFDELTKHGCGMCQGNIDIEDAWFIDWIEDTPICYDCLDVGGNSVDAEN